MQKRTSVILFSILIGIRWILATLPGYVHPDEFFQNPEITSAKIFGLDTQIPWEYKPEHASRSIISPFLTTGIPFWILKQWLSADTLPSSEILFLVERLGSFSWSLVIDICAFKICRHMELENIFTPMFLIATSSVTLAYHTHTFSNAFESVILCLSLCAYLDYTKKPSHRQAFFLGALFSIGVFTRITFPLYALPIGIAFLIQLYKMCNNFHQFIMSTFPLILGITSFATFSIVADSIYYGTLSLTVDGEPFRDMNHVFSTLFNPVALGKLESVGSIVITPLNNLFYNLNVDNLALHGLHPRYTHLAVNLPMLFGPLAFVCATQLPAFAVKAKSKPNAHLFYVLLGIVLTGMVGLSSMPHQEARFLCPLLVPLVLMLSGLDSKISNSFWFVWILFNLITTYIFGMAHQGGIVPTMSLLQRQTTGIHDCHTLKTGDLTCSVGQHHLQDIHQSDFNVTTHIVFYKTYMPPRHLLVHSAESQNNNINILDFGSRMDKVIETLTESVGVTLRRHANKKLEIDFTKSNKTNTYERTLFVTPSFVSLPKIENHRYLLIATFGPHVSFDDMDTVLQKIPETNSPENLMGLNTFLILSNQDDTENA